MKSSNWRTKKETKKVQEKSWPCSLVVLLCTMMEMKIIFFWEIRKGKVERKTHIDRTVPHVMHSYCWIVVCLSHVLSTCDNCVHPMNQTWGEKTEIRTINNKISSQHVIDCETYPELRFDLVRQHFLAQAWLSYPSWSCQLPRRENYSPHSNSYFLPPMSL